MSTALLRLLNLFPKNITNKHTTMQVTATILATLLNGTVEGNPDVLVHKPSKIEEGEAGTISFLGNPKYESYAYTTASSILLVSQDFVPTQHIAATLIRVEDVYASVAILLERFGAVEKKQATISERASIHSDAAIATGVSIGDFVVVEQGASIGENSVIYPQVYIGEQVKIGANVTLYPGVRIYKACEIGDNCILHANTVIGSDGFGFAPMEDGSYKKVAQIGNVVIEKNVEIGANTAIDRATMGSTIIREGVKLDNLIQIAHNVEIGKNTVIAAQTGIAGSTKLGEQCMIGGQSGFVGHLTIADGTKTQAQTGIASSIKEPNKAWFGYPAIPYNDYLRAFTIFKKLPDLAKRVYEIERKLTPKDDL
jgi:UDP-3-O-[3-hydroxymyristoyl] glucosamine N-acyltransferase